MSVGPVGKKQPLFIGAVALLCALGWGWHALRHSPERKQKVKTESAPPAGHLMKETAAPQNDPEPVPAPQPDPGTGPSRHAGENKNTLIPAISTSTGQSDEPVPAIKTEPDLKYDTLYINLMIEAETAVKYGHCFAAAIIYKKALQLKPGDPVAIKELELTRSAEECAEELRNLSLIPAGEFLMGSPEGEAGTGESPRHKVYLDAYYIGKYEVTAGQYRDFAQAARHQMHTQPAWSSDSHPVVNVNSDDAASYCKWTGGRLPTEAEWEKAARGGTDTTYSFGEDDSKLGEYAWYSGNSSRKAHPVGRKKPNQYGLHDMHGNVWELVSDWYADNYYKNSPARNPKGPSTGSVVVQRGGAWGSDPGFVRAAIREWSYSDLRYKDVGFRCVIPYQDIR